MHAVWPLVVLVFAGAVADKPLATMPSSVRATSGTAAMLRETTARSATVRDLILRLAATDVIVYVEMTASPDVPTARTRFVVATPTARFLRIGISRTTPPFDAPALLAHELQHAVEIAERPEVRDDEGVRRLYGEIGHSHGTDRYETDAARTVERTVRSELRARIKD